VVSERDAVVSGQWEGCCGVVSGRDPVMWSVGGMLWGGECGGCGGAVNEKDAVMWSVVNGRDAVVSG